MRKYFFRKCRRRPGGPGAPWAPGGKGLRPDFSVFFIFFVYDTLPYTKTIRDEEKRDTDQKAPFFYLIYLGPRKAPGVVFTFWFLRAHGLVVRSA